MKSMFLVLEEKEALRIIDLARYLGNPRSRILKSYLLLPESSTPRNPLLMSSAEEENDDQREHVSFLKQDLDMEREDLNMETEDVSVVEFASRDIVSFNSSECTTSENINLGNNGDRDLKQKINGELAI